jgi:hypothetical protein
MVTKRTIKRKSVSKAQGTKKFSISVIHKMGPYGSQQEALAAKSKIKRSVSHAQFTALSHTSRGFSFETRTSYTKALPAELTTVDIAAHLRTQSPDAKVSVKLA